MLPLSLSSKPQRSLEKVLFPLPLGPIRATTSPLSREKSSTSNTKGGVFEERRGWVKVIFLHSSLLFFLPFTASGRGITAPSPFHSFSSPFSKRYILLKRESKYEMKREAMTTEASPLVSICFFKTSLQETSKSSKDSSYMTKSGSVTREVESIRRLFSPPLSSDVDASRKC